VSERGEARLLLAILAGRIPRAEDLARGVPPDPRSFVALCGRCDVHPQVHAALERAGRPDLLGAEIEASLAAARNKVRLDNLVLLASLSKALDVLRAAGVRPVALKGVDFVHRLYRSFDERTMDDIDLLVPPSDRDAAIEALERAGWTAPRGLERTHWLKSSYEMPLASAGPITVGCEIHWGLGQEKRYAIDADAVVARAVPLPIDGREVLRLDDQDAAAHLLLHHVQHYFDRRLKWALDLAALSRQPAFSWDGVAARLSEWGGRGAAGLALAHLRKLFPDLIDGAAARAIPAASWRLAATWPVRSAHPLDFFRGTRRRAVQLWIAAAALERPGDLASYWLHRRVRDRLS
jgi:hypothetical protein